VGVGAMGFSVLDGEYYSGHGTIIVFNASVLHETLSNQLGTEQNGGYHFGLSRKVSYLASWGQSKNGKYRFGLSHKFTGYRESQNPIQKSQ
jgi:hypothetical protein